MGSEYAQFSEVRSTLALMRRSRRVSHRDYLDAVEECSSYLARRILNYPPTIARFGLELGMSKADRMQRLGLSASSYERNNNEQEFLDMLAVAGKKKLRHQWVWRIGQETVFRAEKKWFGFFVTLTVDPAKVPDSRAMWQEGREFRKYIRRLAKVSASACGCPRAIHDGASASDFVKYVGVIEHGKSRHHHHMHLLIWMKDIPESWKVCPNRGARRPQDRTIDWCKPMATYWPNSKPGLGRAKFFRHEDDVWTELGFCLPFSRQKNRVVRINPPELAGLYVAKYMDKDDKVWLHRVKATRNLGMSRIKAKLSEMSLRKIEALTWRPRNHALSISLQTMQTVPGGLLRSMAKQELFVRRWASGRADWKALLTENCGAFQRMLESVRDGTRPSRMSLKAFFDWVTSHLPEPTGYCEARLLRAYQSLAVEFSPVNFQKTEHLGIT